MYESFDGLGYEAVFCCFDHDTDGNRMTTVLVIEDNELIRDSIENLLHTRGFNATSAEDGQSGLELAREMLPDVILCDVRIPGLDGYEVLKALRSDPTTAAIPFIILTAESHSSVLVQGKILGANGYLTKPFTTAALLDAIATQLER